MRRVHPRLGALRFDANRGWWDCRLPTGAFPNLGEGVLHCYVRGAADVTESRLDGAAHRMSRVELVRATARAAADLLKVHNESWRETDGNTASPLLTAAEFEARLRLEGLVVREGGDIELSFADGDLFWGHEVVVDLDAELIPIHASIQG